MIARWWAPQRATLTPDAVVKAIFDTPGDVATAMLGAHRAGAAALETVAKGVLPSEMGLVQAMATARAQFAPAMVKSLATAIGDGSYAGLLARDVLDAAEVGALDLFRTCVAKGLSPPLAAQRAGAVYGVPMRELGQYTPLALDPRANPLALVDAADRAMLTYFDKISKAETSTVVSKAPQRPVTFREPERPGVTWDPKEHPRGEDGEFVRAGGLVIPIAPEKVETAPVETPAQPQPQRPQRVQRAQRVQRVQRTQRQVRQAAAPTSSVARPGVQVRRPVARVVRPRHDVDTLKELNKDVAPTLIPPPRLGRRTYDSARHNDAMDFLSAQDRDWEFNPDQVAIPLDPIVGRDLRRAMPGDNTDRNPKIFRLGHLTELAGEPEFLDSPEAHDALTAYSAQFQKEVPGYVHPKTWVNFDADTTLRDYHKDVMSRGQRSERRHIQVANDYETGDEILVHLQPNENDVNSEQRVELEIDEYVLMDGFMGEVNSGGSRRQHPQIELDPNQTYRVAKKPKRFYDRARNMFVNRFELFLVSEEEAEAVYRQWHDQGGSVGKAVREADHWRVQPRNADGEWVNELVARSQAAHQAEEAKEAEEQPATRLQRTGRTQRAQRTQRTQRAETASIVSRPASTVSRTRSRLSRSNLQALELSLRKPPPQNATMPVLDDRPRYHVFRMSEFYAKLDPDTVLSPRQILRLTGLEHERFATVGEMRTGEGVATVLANNVERMVREKEGSLYDSWDENRKSLGMGIARTDDDWSVVGRRIRQIQLDHPEIALITVDHHDGDNYQIFGSTKQVEDQVIVEYEDDIDMDAPMEFVPIGTYQSVNMGMRRSDVPGGAFTSLSSMTQDSPTNSRVVYLRAHNAQVHRFRAGNR